jgi:hypothetical protein
MLLNICSPAFGSPVKLIASPGPPEFEGRAGSSGASSVCVADELQADTSGTSKTKMAIMPIHRNNKGRFDTSSSIMLGEKIPNCFTYLDGIIPPANKTEVKYWS